MRKFLSALLVAALMMSLIPAAFAASGDDVRIVYEGKEASFVYGLNAEDGVITVALSDIVTLLGAQCNIETASRRITLRFGRHCLRMTMGSAAARDNGKDIALSRAVTNRNGTVYVPFEDIMSALCIGYYTDAETSAIYITRAAGGESIPEDVRIPILMYHAVSDDIWGSRELFVSPSEMEKQLAYLEENGYTTITFEDLPRVDEIEKPVMLTFDDGYRDNYEELFPLLQKYNAKATVFVITGAIGNDLYLTADMIKEMSDSGLVSIQSHTETHPDLDKINAEKTHEEFAISQQKLTRITGKQPFVLCYPTGYYSETTLSVIDDYYNYAVKMSGGVADTSGNPFKMNRIYVSRYSDISAFAAKVKA